MVNSFLLSALFASALAFALTDFELLSDLAGLEARLRALLDSLLGPAEVLVCAVCSKDTFPSLAALRRHLAYHPHSQCRGKVPRVTTGPLMPRCIFAASAMTSSP